MVRGSSFCYICLDNDGLLMNMDLTGSNKVRLLDMLTYLSFETSCMEEDIPMYICNDCHKQLRAAYDLKVMCQKNNIHVRRYIFYLKQFTHPTSFTNEQTAKHVQKENTKKKSETDELITINMDLTDLGDESDVEIIETGELASKNQGNTKVDEEHSEISNTSILSKRPEFNSEQSQLFTINKSNISSVKIIKSSDTKVNKKASSANKVSTVLNQTKILSNRPEFNIYKNISQTDTKTSNNKETSGLTEQSSSAKTNSKSVAVNNVTSSTNKKNKLLKKPSNKSLKQVRKTKIEDPTNVNIDTRPDFVEFDMISTVKLRKRTVVKPLQISNNSYKKPKVQKMTYHVKKDRKLIQRMNKCKVVLSRCLIVKKELPNSENYTSKTNLNINKNVQDNGKSMEIKEETNNLENCTVQKNTNTLLINSPSQEQSLPFENIPIKQEIDDEDKIDTEVDLINKPIETDEFSIKIEIVDDNSRISCYGTDKVIKKETIAEVSKNTENVSSSETGINSVFSFTNAEFLTPYGQTTSSNEDLTKTVTNNNDTEAIVEQGNYSAMVGTAGVSKSTDKALELINVHDNMSTTCNITDSDVSGELIIDEDASKEKSVGKTASFSSVPKPAVSKISPRSAGKNIFKRFLNFTNETPVLNAEQGQLPPEKLTRTVGTPAPAVAELQNDLSTVQLPHYKFPVSKRLLNFSCKEQAVDNSAQTSNQVQFEHKSLSTNVSNLNSKSTTGKTAVGKPASHLRVAQLHNEHRKVLKTIGTPATKVKTVSTLRKLPKKVGNPVVIGANVGQTEESPINFMAKQMQMMNRYMSPLTEVGFDGITTKQTNKCDLTSPVGSTELSEGTTSSSVPAESNEDNLTVSNETGNITSVNLVHLESCNKEGSCKCSQKSHSKSNGLLSPSEITIETDIQPEETQDQTEVPISNKDWSLKCPICNKYFRTTLNLKKHALIHKNFYHCPICTEKFSTKAKFKVHMLIHEECKHKCLMCDTRTLTNKSLVQHYKTQHKTTKVCTKCKLIFDTDSDYFKHMTCHYSKRTCTICNRAVSAKTFKTHMKSHERSKCSLCEKYFDNKQLNKHNCTEQWEKTYKCTECDRTFYFQPSLERHMMVHYEMQCFICNTTFSKPHAIVEHMSKHIGPNGYQCPICQLCTFSKDNMKLHMTEHYGQIHQFPAQINTKYL